jgi:hypothetical protein
MMSPLDPPDVVEDEYGVAGHANQTHGRQVLDRAIYVGAPETRGSYNPNGVGTFISWLFVWGRAGINYLFKLGSRGGSLVAKARAFLSNTNLDESSGSLGLRGWMNFLLSCPAVDAVDCTGGVGGLRAFLDIIVWYFVGIVLIGYFVPSGIVSLIVFWGTVVVWLIVFPIHAWRLPPMCMGTQIPVCAPRDAVDIFFYIFRACYNGLFPAGAFTAVIPAPSAVGNSTDFVIDTMHGNETCAACGATYVATDCAALGFDTPVVVFVTLLYRALPSTCAWLPAVPNSMLLLRWIYPTIGNSLTRACAIARLSDSDAGDSGIAAQIRWCAFSNIGLLLEGVLVLAMLVLLVGVGLSLLGLAWAFIQGIVAALGGAASEVSEAFSTQSELVAPVVS